MLNMIEEAKFEALRRMCRDLKVPAPPEIFVGLKVHDQNGILQLDDIQRGHSWTRNYYNYQLGNLIEVAAVGDTTFAAGKISGKQLGGTITGTLNNGVSRSVDAASYYNRGTGENTTTGNFGIFVGTGVTAFSVENTTLSNKVVPGNAANQLLYNAMVYPVTSYNAGTKTWTNVISRVFNNNSGGTIVVTETGLVWYSYLYGNIGYYLCERNLLSTSISLVNGAQLTVNYTLTMDFSAID